MGAQDAGYEVGDYLIALEAKHPGKLWEVLTCGRASKFAPAEQAPGPVPAEETSLNVFKNNLPEVRPSVSSDTATWACAFQRLPASLSAAAALQACHTCLQTRPLCAQSTSINHVPTWACL